MLPSRDLNGPTGWLYIVFLCNAPAWPLLNKNVLSAAVKKENVLSAVRKFIGVVHLF